MISQSEKLAGPKYSASSRHSTEASMNGAKWAMESDTEESEEKDVPTL